MKVIILAASRGRRLGQLTEDKPKCMLQFGGETIIERQVRLIQECGLSQSDIIVVAGYCAEKLNLPEDICILQNREYNTTDNSYSLLLALQRYEDEILILDGDLVFERTILKMVLTESGNVILGNERINRYGMTGIIYDENLSVLSIGKHIISEMAYASIMKLDKNSAFILKKELEERPNKTTWYTVPINRLLKYISFKLLKTNNLVMGINTYFDYIEAKKIFGIEDYTILVTGASGFLGKKIYHILKRNYNVIGIKGKSSDAEFSTVDIENYNELFAYIELIKPSVIIHAAGMPDPDVCEREKERAWSLNVEATKSIVAICQKRNIKLIYISTDYVFDGESKEEYGHESARNPGNYYGETKKQAEDVVKDYESSLIVRMPIIYGYNDENDKVTFPIMVLKSLKAGKELRLDNQQIRYPVLIDEIAFSIKDALPKTGIIHITSDVPVTKYTWAKRIAKEFGMEEKLIVADEGRPLYGRPSHVKLKVTSFDYIVSDVSAGIVILKKQLRCIFKLIYKGNPIDNIYGINIGEYRFLLGKSLGNALPKEIMGDLDYIVPVPNSGLYYAMGIAAATQIPYLQALIKPDTYTRSFQLADIALREQVISKKILPVRELLKDRRIALVDEAIFTGTTLRVVCDIVKACGAKKIYLLLPMPACTDGCRQYVQPERKLLSREIDEGLLADYFKVDGVYMQHYEKYEESIADIENICYDCFRRKL